MPDSAVPNIVQPAASYTETMSKNFLVPESFNPELLIWARLNQGMSREVAASQMGIHAVALMEYELGTRQPMWSFIEECARVYKRPSAVFLLDEPPKQDRRVLTGIKLLYSDGTEEKHVFED